MAAIVQRGPYGFDVQESALRTFNEIAASQPAEKLITDLTEHYAALNGQDDQQFNVLLGIALSVEEHQDAVHGDLERILNLVSQALKTGNTDIQNAASLTILQLCEVLGGEDGDALEGWDAEGSVTSVLKSLVTDAETQFFAVNAIKSFVSLKTTIAASHVSYVLDDLATLLDDPAAPVLVKAAVVATMREVMDVAETEEFAPYADATIARLTPLFSLTDDEDDLRLRAASLNTISSIAVTVGPDDFRPFLVLSMESAIEGLEHGQPWAVAPSLSVFTSVAILYQAGELAPYVSRIEQVVLESLKIPTSLQDDAELADLLKAARPSFLHVGKLVGSADALVPHIEEYADVLLSHLSHPAWQVREAAVEALFELVIEASEQELFTKAKLKLLVQKIVPAVLALYENEQHYKVVVIINKGFAAAMEAVGQVVAEDNLDDVSNMVIQILNGEAICQLDPSTPPGRIASENLAVSALKMLQTYLFTHPTNLRSFWGPIAKHTEQARPTAQRIGALNCLLGAILGSRERVTPHTNTILDILFRAMSDSNAGVQAHACFVSGHLVEQTKADLTATAPRLLTIYRNLVDLEPEEAPIPELVDIMGKIREQGMGAVSRMYLRNPALVPIAEFMPKILGIVPCRHDIDANNPAYNAMSRATILNPDIAAEYGGAMMQSFIKVLEPGYPREMLDNTVREKLLETLRLVVDDEEEE